MIVPLVRREVETACSSTEAFRLVEAVLNDELPVCAVDDVWPDIDEAMAGIQPQLEAHGFESGDRIATFRHEVPSARRARLIARGGLLSAFASIKSSRAKRIDFSGVTRLHADSLPSESLVSRIVVNHTEQGEVEARFFEPADAFLEAYRRHQSQSRVRRELEFAIKVLRGTEKDDLILPEVRRQLANNRLDDDYLIPVEHRVIAHQGMTIVFRAGGHRPLYHEFRSLVMPRVSKVRAAVLGKDSAAQSTTR